MSSTVTFDTLAQGGNSGVTTARTQVVRDAAAWDALWAEHGSRFIPPPTQANVDFRNTQVLAVFLGSRPNACYGLEITHVEQDDTHRVVTYRESAPAVGAVCPASMTFPAHIVAVPTSTLPVTFVSTH